MLQSSSHVESPGQVKRQRFEEPEVTAPDQEPDEAEGEVWFNQYHEVDPENPEAEDSGEVEQSEIARKIRQIKKEKDS